MLEASHSSHSSWYNVIKVVVHLQVEQTPALRTTNIGLVTIVTKPLATAL
jgi:hypothetical protein